MLAFVGMCESDCRTFIDRPDCSIWRGGELYKGWRFFTKFLRWGLGRDQNKIALWSCVKFSIKMRVVIN